MSKLILKLGLSVQPQQLREIQPMELQCCEFCGTGWGQSRSDLESQFPGCKFHSCSCHKQKIILVEH
jgi:hypothetical protein